MFRRYKYHLLLLLFVFVSKETYAQIAIIPFENHNGTIILKLYINDYKEPLRFVFDTGADGMAVDRNLAEKIGLQITRENNASVVGGNQKIQVSEKNKVRLEGLELGNMGIAIFPDRTDGKSDGIIGNTILQRFLANIDYDSNTLSLYNFSNQQPKSKNSYEIPVNFKSGLLHVQGDLKVGQGQEVAGEFIYDTGAAYSLICFRPFVKENKLLVNGFKVQAQAATISLGITTPTFTGYAEQFSLHGVPNLGKQLITLMGGNSNNKNWDPGADGSLGVRLISRYNSMIDLANHRILLSPNKLHSLPHDFILKNRLIGWNNQGKLVLLTHIGSLDSEFNNKLIASIDGQKAEKLAKNKNLIESLNEKIKTSSLVIEFEDGSKITI